MTRRRRSPGQVLVFFAIVLPLVLLPIVAYAVDAAVTSAAYSHLVEVTALAAQDAAEQIDVTALRLTGAIVLDIGKAAAAAQGDLAGNPGAHLDSVGVAGGVVRVATSQAVKLPLDFVGGGSVMLHAGATARIAPGYDKPSSPLPLPVNSF